MTDHPLTWLYLTTSLLSFLVYAYDKLAASSRGWRIPERTLLLLDLISGWPGGLLAQQLFRHKTRKQGYQFLFWTCVVLNCVLVFFLAKTLLD